MKTKLMFEPGQLYLFDFKDDAMNKELRLIITVKIEIDKRFSDQCTIEFLCYDGIEKRIFTVTEETKEYWYLLS